MFSSICCSDKSNFYITHGDAGGNIIANGGKYYIIDWDDPILAPPERDAWFCLCWDWAVNTFNNELLKNGIDYKLRPERLAYYCYNFFFFYLTEYMQTYLEIGDKHGSMVEKLKDHFSCWIGNVLQYADKMF